MTNSVRPATRQMKSGGGPSPQWIARFYKAICGVWLHQEIVNFCNIMHSQCTTALHTIRKLDLLTYPKASIWDNTDLIKAWNILFERLLALPFQPGSPATFPVHNRTTFSHSPHAYRLPEISDLLAPSSMKFPPDHYNHFMQRGSRDIHQRPCLSLSRPHKADSPSEDGSFLDNTLRPTLGKFGLRLAWLFQFAGIGRRRSCGTSFWVASSLWRLFIHCANTWRKNKDSAHDLFASYEMSDQVVEDIFGKALMKELLRRDLDPHVPFAMFHVADWHVILALCLRAAGQKSCYITKWTDWWNVADGIEVDAEPANVGWLHRFNKWYNTYRRLRNETEGQDEIPRNMDLPPTNVGVLATMMVEVFGHFPSCPTVNGDYLVPLQPLGRSTHR
jgi:hypothetical protein